MFPKSHCQYFPKVFSCYPLVEQMEIGFYLWLPILLVKENANGPIFEYFSTETDLVVIRA